MCRMFALWSYTACPVQAELLGAAKSLGRLSLSNNDGWGVAYFVDGSPHVVKSPTTASGDSVFQALSDKLNVKTLIAHVRRATQGTNSISNTQPYQFGRWLFTHNGNIADFSEKREELIKQICPEFRSHLFGQSDSEVFFLLLITAMKNNGIFEVNPCHSSIAPSTLWNAISPMVEYIATVGGGIHNKTDGSPDKTYLTFILTDGRVMLGHQGGKSLYAHAPLVEDIQRDKEIVKSYLKVGVADHFLLASEPIHDQKMWAELSFRDVVGIDEDMTVWKTNALIKTNVESEFKKLLSSEKFQFSTSRLSIESWKDYLSDTKQMEILAERVVMMLSEKVTKNLPQEWAQIKSITNAKNWIQERDNESYVYIVKNLETHQIMGLLFLNETSKDITGRSHLQLGFLLSEEYWGKGLASEMIEGLVNWCITSGEVAKITGGVMADNVASSRVLEKCGFTISKTRLKGVNFYERNFFEL